MRKKIYLQRSLVLFVLLVFLAGFALTQDKKADDEKKLREDILAVYKLGGEKNLTDFFNKNKDKITNKFIVNFADAGVKERKEEWLQICEIMADTKKYEKVLAEVLYRKGNFFRLNFRHENAFYYYEEAFKIYKKINDLNGQGKVYLGRIDIYIQIADFSTKVIEMCDKALNLFESEGNNVGIGHVFLRKGDIYRNTENISLAEKMYEKALQSFEKTGDSFGIGYSYFKKGLVCARNSEYSRALTLYEKAIPFLEKINDSCGLSSVYFLIGEIYYGYNEYGDKYKAIEFFNKSLNLSKKLGNFIGEGNVYRRMGDIYSQTCDNLKAFEMYDKSLYFYKKCDNNMGQGNIYLNKGSLYLYMGDNYKASDMFDKALVFFEQSNDLIGQGTVHQLKGNIYYYTGNNSKAIEMYNKALIFYEKAGTHLDKANLYIDKAILYSRMLNFSLANILYKKALTFYEKSKNYLGEGNVYCDMGEIYFFEKQFSKALEMYYKASILYDKVGDPICQGNIYRALGEVYFSYKKIYQALKMYDKALKFFFSAENKMGISSVYKDKGDVYFYKRDNFKAIEFYDKSIKLYSEIGEIEGESYVIQKKASSYVEIGKKNEALSLFEKAISYLEKVREQTGFSEMKMSFMEKVYKQYEETTRFMLENGYNDKGFKYAEAMKARVFLDQMGEGLTPLEKGLKQELKDERDKLLGKLSYLTKQMQEIAGKDDEKLKKLKEEYQKVNSEFEELLIEIRLDNPVYAGVKYPQPVTVQDIQKDVLKPGETLVSYFISQDTLYAFIVSKDIFKVIPIKIGEKDVANLVKRYNDTLTEKNSFIRHCAALYDKFFQPLEKYLKPGADILIAPDGELAKIPFETFVAGKNSSGQPAYLLEKYNIKYIQSASLLSLLRKYYKRDSASHNFIGFGDPVYDYKNFQAGNKERSNPAPTRSDEISELFRDQYNQEKGALTRLQASGEEVKTIAGLFKNKEYRSVSCLRKEATEEKAKAPDMRGFDYIHFSCHGVLGEMFQGLALSQIPGAAEDGYFTLNEVMNCDYHAKLIVLSACQTGSGKLQKGEGVTGLTRAFMYAGSPAVVAGLWKVDDQATKELMIKFYQNMIDKKMSKPEALRQAKLAFIKDGKFASPYYWSAFVLYGE